MRFRSSQTTASREKPIHRLLCYLATSGLVLGCGGLAADPKEDGAIARSAQALSEETQYSCGYEVSTGNYSTWPGGYQTWVEVTNVDGEVGVDFEVLVDVGDTAIVNGYQADYAEVEGGYSVTAPSWLQWQTIPVGEGYRFAFVGEPDFDSVTTYIISINGVTCDEVPPEISLSGSQGLFTSDGTLTLTAEASDNVAVRKVVFEQDGEVIAEDAEAPYTLDLAVSDVINGRHSYTATAFDPTGNEASSNAVRVLVAIGNRFVGSATASAPEYVDFTTYFNQLTPGNAGKWGSVEATRDVMNWTDLDAAYQFAKDNDIPFKLHTLVWGNQQPNWIAGLPVEEQLAEVEEWMAALAERYPDVDMIDVVNEPLHAPPPYMEALGGEGETGWDWLVTSFEMARSYFPNAELLINDYGILVFEPSTADYLEPIQVLQERDLVDGIGVQAHFLERAELSVVEANLATLAATGLPIYVSELDVNFANDARHANRYRDLFTLFWDNPSVLGVTNWGHLEGYVWRQDGYLIRQDGSTRPALDWLMCFVGGGQNCTVPEYIPEPRIGGEYGLDLEAEEWDDAHGILALGSFIGYTDPDDWEMFARVNFQQDYDTFWVTYAKGNEGMGSISIHLDSLESDPALVVPLPTTGNWGIFQTREVPWPAIEGEHDVYIRFNDVYGVGNIEAYRFGTEEPLPDYGPNVVANGEFESGTAGWGTWGGGTIATSTEHVHGGAQSLVVTDRAGNAPAATNLTSVVSPGTVYQTRFWVSITASEAAPEAAPEAALEASVNVTQAITCEGGSPEYSWIVNPVTVQDGEWVELVGQLALPDCPLADVTVYAEGPPAGFDLYVDDVVVRESLELLGDAGFESGTDGWFSWGGGAVSTTTEIARSGAQSLVVSDRPGNAPAARSLINVVKAGATYDVSLWLTITGAPTAPVNITRAITCEGQPTQYTRLADTTIALEGEWVKLSGELAVPDCTVTGVLIFAEGPPAGVNLYVDDGSVRQRPPEIVNLVTNGDFESGTQGWFSWSGGVIQTATNRAHGGDQSLVVTSRPGNAPAATNVTSAVSPATSYQASFWVSIDGAPAESPEAPVNVTEAITCEGESTQYTRLVDTVIVPEDEWVELVGSLDLPDCPLANVTIYVEGPPADIDLYVDDVVIHP